MKIIFDPVLGALRTSDSTTSENGVIPYFIGSYDASSNTYPSTGGTGDSGAIKKGDTWAISIAGTLPTGIPVQASDTLLALVDNPGQTQSNWNLTQANLLSGTNIKTINGESILGSGDLSNLAPKDSPVFTTSVGIPALSQDDALTQILVRAADGTVKYRASSSIAAPVYSAQTIFVDSQYGNNGTGAINDATKPYATVEYVLANVPNTGTLTVGTTNTSATLTAANTTGIVVGQYLTGTGIPYGSIVVSFTPNTNIIISKPCTATASITATWYQTYDVILTGTHTWASEWNKIGFYIINQGTAIVGNGTMFGGSTVYPISHKIINDGLMVGNHANSRIVNMSGTQVDFFGLEIKVGRIETIGTNAAITTSTGDNDARTYVYGGFINATAGRIVNITSRTGTLDIGGYGLLGGITLATGGATSTSNIGFQVYGNYTSPSGVNVAAISSYVTSFANYSGNITIAGYSSHTGGRVNATTITVGVNSQFEFTNRSNGTITAMGNCSIKLNMPAIMTVSAGVTCNLTGNGVSQASVTFGSSTSVLNNYTAVNLLSGAGTCNNYEQINNGGSSNDFTGTLNNYNYFQGGLGATTANSVTLNNYGEAIINSYGLGREVVAATSVIVNNYGVIRTTVTTMSNATGVINIGNGSIFKNYGGGIIDATSVTNADKSVFNLYNKGGKIYLYQGSVIKTTSNLKSPIRIGVIDNGTTTSTTAFKLIQSGQNFLTTVGVGALVKNTTDATTAIVTAVDSNTQLTLDTDIMVSGETFEIYSPLELYNFGTTTNCDGTTYGLLMPFGVTEIAPIDLVGGTLYENTAY